MPVQLIRWLFINRVGCLPFEVEDTSSDIKLYYNGLAVTKRLSDIDRAFVELMSGSKFNTRGPPSPKKIKWMKEKM
jgi:hypothetical protein